MSGDLVIIPAQQDHVDAIARLSEELGYESTPSQVSQRLVRLQRRGEDLALVALSGSEVVGWIHASLSISLESEPFAEILGLVVAATHRSRGIGSALVSAAESWVACHEYGRVRVRSNVKRAQAREFYEKLGYIVVKTSNVFDKIL